jgi:hypothetical protein
MSKPHLLSALEKDYEELKSQISRLGVMAQGTITARSIPRIAARKNPMALIINGRGRNSAGR